MRACQFSYLSNNVKTRAKISMQANVISVFALLLRNIVYRRLMLYRFTTKSPKLQADTQAGLGIRCSDIPQTPF